MFNTVFHAAKRAQTRDNIVPIKTARVHHRQRGEYVLHIMPAR